MDDEADVVDVPIRPASAREDIITLVLSAWLIGGLFLDGYAHTYVIDAATENFFILWHGVFYAGLLR